MRTHFAQAIQFLAGELQRLSQRNTLGRRRGQTSSFQVREGGGEDGVDSSKELDQLLAATGADAGSHRQPSHFKDRSPVDAVVLGVRVEAMAAPWGKSLKNARVTAEGGYRQ